MEENTEYGIASIKTMLAFVFTAAARGLNIDENRDGRLSFSELFSLVTTISFQFPQLQKAFPFIRKEFRDLDEMEIEALKNYINTELDLPMRYDDVEEAIRLTVNMLHYNYRYIDNLRTIFKEPSTVEEI